MLPFLLTLLAVEPQPDGPATATEEAEKQAAALSLNAATADDLSNLGLSEGQAEAIVALRTERGRFNSVEELRILPGMDDPTLDTLRANTAVDITLASSTGKSYTTVDQVLGEFDHEPSVQEVQRMAMDYTHTNRDQVERWLWASRNSAWLPELKLQYRYTDDYDRDFIFTDGGDSLEYEDGQVDRQWRVTGEVRWRLDDLVMSSEQIRVISESQDVVKLRDKVLGEVTRLYFDRRRLQVDMLMKPSNSLNTQVENTLRLMELTAELDAYTGGAFSARLARGQ